MSPSLWGQLALETADVRNLYLCIVDAETDVADDSSDEEAQEGQAVFAKREAVDLDEHELEGCGV